MFQILNKASKGVPAKAKPSAVKTDVFGDAMTWEVQRMHALSRSEARAWRVAGAAGVIAAGACVAVVGLTPLKTTEPFVLRVDNATGSVEVVRGLSKAKTTYDEAVNKYFTAQYVKQREGFLRESFPQSYELVGLMSSPAETTRLAALWGREAPTNPLKLYGAAGRAQAQIKSISFLSSNVAFVRFLKTVDKPGEQSATHWTATVAFEYVGLKMSEEDRIKNPLGFQVTDYRVDADVQTDTTQPGTQSGQAAQPAQPLAPVPSPSTPAAAPAAGQR